MFLIWGRGEGSAVLGDFEEQECPVCEKNVLFQAVLHYTYRHIWYLCCWVTGREYYAVCSHCGNGMPLDKAEAKKAFPKDAVPFIKKKGWMLVLLLIACLLGFGVMKGQEGGKLAQEYLSAPQVGDLYLADFASLEGSGFETDGSSAYGVMRLEAVEGDNLVFVLPLEAYSKRKGVRKALSSSKEIAYDYEAPLLLGKSRVRELYDKRTIYEIRR